MFENRRWLVIPTSLTGSIDFTQVQESSTGSLRFSVDGTKTFIKYDINEITASYDIEFINAETGDTEITTMEAGVYGRPSIYNEGMTEYNHAEILELLSTAEWTEDIYSGSNS